MTSSLQKNIRVTADQWKRIETAARERQVSPNRLVVELAIEALDRREWPGTGAEIKGRASFFAAQAIARDLIADGRENEIEEILQFASALVSETTKHIGEQDRRTRFASLPSPGRENSLRQPGLVQSLA